MDLIDISSALTLKGILWTYVCAQSMSILLKRDLGCGAHDTYLHRLISSTTMQANQFRVYFPFFNRLTLKKYLSYVMINGKKKYLSCIMIQNQWLLLEHFSTIFLLFSIAYWPFWPWKIAGKAAIRPTERLPAWSSNSANTDCISLLAAQSRVQAGATCSV